MINSDDHFRFLSKCIHQKPSRILISTYNIYTGITSSGKDMTSYGHAHQSQSRDLLEIAKSDKAVVQIMVGTYDYKSCKGIGTPCVSCEKKYLMGLFKIQNHAEKFPEFELRVSTKTHAKFTIFGYKDKSMRGVAGGRNFADSIWADATIELDQDNIVELLAHFDKVWESSLLPNTTWIESLIKNQGISQEAIKALDEWASL